jgi:hypothetical protein
MVLLEILAIAIPAIITIGMGFITYRKDVALKRLEAMVKALNEKEKVYLNGGIIIENLLTLPTVNLIHESVERIFKNTKADQFLLMFAQNGKSDFNTISVSYEQHDTGDKQHVNALVRYRNVEIDTPYRDMLHYIELHGDIELETKEMQPQLLKDFYTLEKIKQSSVRFLSREHIDVDNDVILYCSVSTHSSVPCTNIDKVLIKTEIEGSILHVVKERLKEMKEN